jgi:hypothetical protein
MVRLPAIECPQHPLILRVPGFGVASEDSIRGMVGDEPSDRFGLLDSPFYDSFLEAVEKRRDGTTLHRESSLNALL